MHRFRKASVPLIRLALCLSLLTQTAFSPLTGAPMTPAAQTPTPPLFDCFSQLDPLYARTNVLSLMQARSAADLLAARGHLATTIWGPGGLPTTRLPPESGVELGVTPPMEGMPNLKRVDQITLEMPLPEGAPVASLRSVVYHFRALNSINRLMIFHQGHEERSAPLSFSGGALTVARHLAAGFDVLAFQMPLYGDNATTLTSHDQLATFKSADFNPLRYFMEPIAVGLNYALGQSAYEQVGMIGISGGGWATTLYAALDPRVSVSIPVAGSLPYFLRDGRCANLADPGDWEQKEVNLFLDYTDLYLMGAFGHGRKHLQVLNQFDTCCFSGVRHQTYAPAVKSVLSGIGDGFFDVYLDDSHTTHSISSVAVDAAFKVLFDPPVNEVPGPQAVAVDTPVTFSAANSNLIAVTGAGNHPLRVTLTAGAGAITLAGTTELSFREGDGADDPTMTFDGTAPAVNAALNGMVFRPEPGFSGAATLTLTSGNQNIVGKVAAQADIDLIFINVGATVQFDRASYEVPEGAGRAHVFVTRTGSLGALSVAYSVESGTATAGEDFVANSGTLNFAAGEVSKSVEVALLDDELDEPDETIILTLINPTGGVLGGPAPAVIRVGDDDETPALAIDDLTIPEGDSGTVNAVFSVTLSAPSAREVTVYAGTVHVTTDAQDYEPVYNQLSFAPGETLKTVAVPIKGDTLSEAHETFFVGLVGADNATVADALGFGTIRSDDGLVRIAGEATQSVAEDAGKIVITVTRTGDLSLPASVAYHTADDTATSLRDYTYASGTLDFDAGDDSATFSVLITHDFHDEPGEHFTVELSDAVGAILDPERSAIRVTIVDDDPEGQTANPNDITPAFVAQHYHDFLGREPDAGGLQFWSEGVELCGADPQCRQVKRVDTSAAFFLSIEFQETGYLVYRTYKAAYGDATSPGVAGAVPVIRLVEFLNDSRRVGQGVQVGVGDWQAQIEASKQAYMVEFVEGPRFTDAFPASMTADAFVAKLDQNAGGVLSAAERAQLIGWLGTAPGGAQPRARVLRAVAEHAELHRREFNRAFVLMQYFGYLRRNPDDAPDTNFDGWRFWLDKLEANGGDFRRAEMVRAFLESIEYRRRFGQ